MSSTRLKKFTMYFLMYFLLLSVCIILTSPTSEKKVQTSSDTVKLQESIPKPQSTNKPEPKTEKKDEIKVTFIELGSVRCILCKMMQLIMRDIEKEYSGQVKVVFYDVWTAEGQPYAEKYKIRLIPTQVFLDKNGNEYFRHEGFFPKEELVKILEIQGVKR